MPKKLQRVDVSKNKAFCDKCGASILDITNFEYLGRTKNEPRFKEETCACKHCRTKFILIYHLFTPQEHVNPLVFSEDINDADYNWQDNLTDKQKQEIAAHLRQCSLCYEKLDEERLADSWFASIVHGVKNET